MVFNGTSSSNPGSAVSESAYSVGGAGSYGTGGGASVLFARPSWQSGPGVPAGTARLVPDVAAIFNANLLTPYIVLNGQTAGFTGTSLSSPVWAGLCALINQARSEAGLQPLGVLGPNLYPLLGTAALHDIVSGTNGAYSAGPGYDCCSGVGTPDIGALIRVLAGAQGSLINLSSRGSVGAGAPVMVAGFTVGSGGAATVVIRGVGPTLSQYGVSGALASPRLDLYDSTGAIIATDIGWGNSPSLGPSTVAFTIQAATAAEFSEVYAFPLPAGSADCAMLATLPPGSYTAQVSGLNGSTGVGLVEVYQIP